MSQISKDLQEQQDKNIADAMRKVFGDIPVIDAEAVNREERNEVQRKITEQLNRRLDALKTR
jgi:hypothetical protein